MRILDGAESAGSLTRDDVRGIRATLRLNDGWQVVKRGGLASLPGGDAYDAGQRLVDELASLGVYVVPVGELERWFPEVAGHGTNWVTETLARGLHTRQGTGVWGFMARVKRAFCD